MDDQTECVKRILSLVTCGQRIPNMYLMIFLGVDIFVMSTSNIVLKTYYEHQSKNALWIPEAKK